MKTKIGNVGILIICRLNSQRLKNKILKKIYNKTLIQILLERLLKKIYSKNIVICTSNKNKNKFFKQISEKYKIKTFYGDDRNIFSRIINCSNKFKFKNTSVGAASILAVSINIFAPSGLTIYP